MSTRTTSAPPFTGPTYRLSVVGCGGVGKSALTIQFVQGRFVTEHDPTIEDSYLKICTIDGIDCKLTVLDTAGQEQFQVMRDAFMKLSEGFLLVFSFTDRNSLDVIRLTYKHILRVKDRDHFPMVLVGNKCDTPEYTREVSSDQAKLLAKELRLHYIETSAKVNHNIQQAFCDAVRLIKKFHEEERLLPVVKPKKKKRCTIL